MGSGGYRHMVSLSSFGFFRHLYYRQKVRIHNKFLGNSLHNAARAVVDTSASIAELGKQFFKFGVLKRGVDVDLHIV